MKVQREEILLVILCCLFPPYQRAGMILNIFHMKK